MEKEHLTLIKVGGKIVENEDSLVRLLKNFSLIPGHKVLVHGGGALATEFAKKIGIESHMVNGRRVTDAEMLKVVTMIYGGLVNKHIVALLQSMDVQAIGLTGADMNVIRSHKRPVADVDYGFVGDVDRVDAKSLFTLIDSGVVPILAPLTHDKQGTLLNTNADTIAGEVAKALSAYFDVTLIFCFEKMGVLCNPDDDSSVIHHISSSRFPQLVEQGIVSGGMLPKIQNSLDAVSHGVSRVIITKAENIATPECGTIIE